MNKTTIYENIGFGDFAKRRISIAEGYNETDVFIDGVWSGHGSTVKEAVEKAVDKETAAWILWDMFPETTQE